MASLGVSVLPAEEPVRSALTADALALASAEVTVLFVSIGLIDGDAVGKRGVGHLVDVGCAADDVLPAVAAVCELSAAAAVYDDGADEHGWRRCSRSLRQWMCRSVYVDPVVEDAASGAGVWRWSGHRDRRAFYPAVFWSLAGWTMWGIFVCAFRFALERRRQMAEQEAALHSLEATLEISR